jgi:hypothetical protein
MSEEYNYYKINSQEYNYYKMKADMDFCLCGHQALIHAWWVDSDGSGRGLVQPDLEACDWLGCRCEKYQRDNLRYLERKYVESQKNG